jgi:hypothetical protein
MLERQISPRGEVSSPHRDTPAAPIAQPEIFTAKPQRAEVVVEANLEPAAFETRLRELLLRADELGLRVGVPV